MLEVKLPFSALGVSEFKNTLRFYSLMDAILSPEWDYRYYSFDSQWDANEAMASMRNGQGDSFVAHFTTAGCFLKGFDHECPMSPWSKKESTIWPGLFDSVPEEFASSLTEPAFDMESTSFCLWRRESDTAWLQSSVDFPVGEDPDGKIHLLGDIDTGVQRYCRFAEDYFEVEVNSAKAELIRKGEPLSNSLIASLNAEVSLASLADDLNSIDWKSYAPVTL